MDELYAVEVENVSMHFNMSSEKIESLKEYFLKLAKGKLFFKDFVAVSDVSLKIKKGEVFGIVGTNGSGKSTLLKMISGILTPTTGKVTINGTIAPLIELGAGFDGELTVKENTYLRGALLGYTKEFMNEKYHEIIDFAELQEFENTKFRQLSSGMKSRLAFSIASLVNPELLILDEVLSVGDGAFREKSEKKMRSIIESGIATILVSHSISQIRRMSTKVLWLNKGKQIMIGDTKQVCDLYEEFLKTGKLPQ